LNGLLPVDKPQGWTSHDVVDWVRRRLGIRKAGHTGTLDPMATGVLVLCLGGSTRLSPFLTGLDKQYRTRVRLGVSTDTLDADGTVVARSGGVPEDVEAISCVVGGFVGQIEQIPPMFSARKVSGQRLYRLARSGRTVPRQSRVVNIYQIDIERFDPPWLDLFVRCSTGTYIRVLANDIGRELGCGGHVAALRRTAVGSIGQDACVSVAWLREVDPDGVDAVHLLDPNRALQGIPGVQMTPDQVRRFAHGNPVAIEHIETLEGGEHLVRALDLEGRLWGIGRWTGDEGMLKPVRVIRKQEGENGI